MIILCFMIVLLVGGCFCRLFENHQKKSHLNFIAKNAAAFVQVLLNCVKSWQNSQSCKVRIFSLFQPLLIDFSILHESSDENCLQAFPVEDNSLFCPFRKSFTITLRRRQQPPSSFHNWVHVNYVIFFFQTFGHNCARQRDKIPTLLEEFAIAQEEVIHKGPCHTLKGKIWSSF